MNLEVSKHQKGYDIKKIRADTFRGYKLTSKICLIYLEAKLHKGRCVWCIKIAQKLAQVIYLKANKQQAKYYYYF